MTGQNLEAFQALAELDKKERSVKEKQSYYRAYVLSVLIPPIGIYYFIKYVFLANGTDEDIKAGITSLVITIISLILTIWLFGVFFKQTTSTLPKQYNDVLKEFITPENQKKFKELMQ
jgi:hypothetical protein